MSVVKTQARPISDNSTHEDAEGKAPHFLRAAGELPADAESVLKSLRVRYNLRADGKYVVDGDLDVSGRNLDHLPDLGSIVIFGKFKCTENNLATLANAPREALEYITDFGQFLSWLQIPSELRD